MARSILITSTDMEELQRISAYLATTTNFRTTKFEVIGDLEEPEKRNRDGGPPPVAQSTNDSVQLRENDNTNVADNPITTDPNPNATNPLADVVKQEDTEEIPINIMDEDIKRHIPIVTISDDPSVVPFVYKIEDDQSETSEEQEVVNNIVPPIDANLHGMEDIEEVKPTIDESNNRCDDLKSSEEQDGAFDIKQLIGDNETEDVNQNDNTMIEVDENQVNDNLNNIEEVGADLRSEEAYNNASLLWDSYMTVPEFARNTVVDNRLSNDSNEKNRLGANQKMDEPMEIDGHQVDYNLKNIEEESANKDHHGRNKSNNDESGQLIVKKPLKKRSEDTEKASSLKNNKEQRMKRKLQIFREVDSSDNTEEDDERRNGSSSDGSRQLIVKKQSNKKSEHTGKSSAPKSDDAPKKIKCRKCPEMFKLGTDFIETAENHAYHRHLCEAKKLKFECRDCRIFLGSWTQVRLHSRNSRRTPICDIREVGWNELSNKRSENKRRVRNEVKSCFPHIYLDIYNLRRCKECSEDISARCEGFLLSHALTHMNIMKYKCGSCHYQSKTLDEMESHGKEKHSKDFDARRMKIRFKEPMKQKTIAKFFQNTPHAAQNSNAPSTSISSNGNASSRHTNKRGKDMVKDSDDDDGNMVKKQKIVRFSKDVAEPTEDIECQKCSEIIPNKEEVVASHAISHANIDCYKCPDDQCDEKTVKSTEILAHHHKKHEDIPFVVKLIRWNDEEYEQFQEVMKECFPAMKTTENQCQLCNQPITTKKETHASHHLNLMLYKCCSCLFESSTASELECHDYIMHITCLKTEKCRIKLTKEQEAEMKEGIIKCFPEE